MLEDLPSELDRGPLDPVRIFEVLQRHEVEYLTIDAVAVNVHGHVRNTRDVDLLIEWSAENMRRLAAALDELDARLFGVDADLIGVDPHDPEGVSNGGNFTLRTAAGGLDLFDPGKIPGGRPYEVDAPPRGRGSRRSRQHSRSGLRRPDSTQAGVWARPRS
jgi:hypothetical protein